MTNQQINQLLGHQGHLIIPADGNAYTGTWMAIQLFGISDGSNVTYTVYGGLTRSLALIGTNLPNGYIWFDRFISIKIDASETGASALCYNAPTNFLI